jgi:hypothetical protein
MSYGTGYESTQEVRGDAKQKQKIETSNLGSAWGKRKRVNIKASDAASPKDVRVTS